MHSHWLMPRSRHRSTSSRRPTQLHYMMSSNLCRCLRTLECSPSSQRQAQFDQVTLDEAQRQGVRVIMPFELNQDYDYSDPAIQERCRQEITAWVLRYRDNPAVLMWGPGNEVIHRLIFPTAVQGQKD